MQDDDFRKELDELMRLFKKLVEKKDIDDIPGIDKFQLQQLKFFFSQYDKMKDNLSSELEGQFGEPMKKMIHDLVIQLREELGKDYSIEEEMEENITSDNLTDIQTIDDKLKDPNLSEEEINKLLDKRSKLLDPESY